MNKKIKIAPSILSADFSRLGEEIKAVEEAGADVIHIDVMDGHFVPNITIGTLVVEGIRPVTKLPFDVHLMIENPQNFIDDFVKAGADWITVHQETCVHLHRVISLIKDKGIKAGVVLNPATNLFTIEEILPEVDLVLLMSVNPGFGGQKFIASSIEKIKKLRNMINEKGLNVDIQVDGGIGVNTIQAVSQAGCDIFVAGSAIFGKGDYKEKIEKLRELAG
jgi:ribulose-phosphate 3-epimerase